MGVSSATKSHPRIGGVGWDAGLLEGEVPTDTGITCCEKFLSCRNSFPLRALGIGSTVAGQKS